MTAERNLVELKRLLTEASDMNSACAVLSWDQTTYMPAGGGPTRGRQLALLSSTAHRLATDPEIGRLLDALEPHAAGLDPASDDAALLRRARRDFEHLTRVPAAFVAEFTEHQAASYEAWIRARPADDFAAVEPFLERTLEYSRRLAGYRPGFAHIADPLIDDADEGMTAASVAAVFGTLRSELRPIVQAIAAQAPADTAFLQQHFDEDAQLAFGLEVAQRFGFDFDRGRQDQSAHPYMTRFAWGDVRITTAIRADRFAAGFFGTLHETGHGLYEQGTRPELDGLPTGHGASTGVHESQSRLWENVVGRSRAFWEYHYPLLQAAFPGQLGAVPMEAFYRAVNRVEPSLIRIYADEVTYNLHVILRFELELELLDGKLAVRDLPEAWRARYAADLVAPTDDRDGVLQDVHWFGGHVGGVFHGYALGNIICAQLYAAAMQAHPDIPAETAAGRFGTLHAWLRDHVHVHGAKFPPAELVQKATGNPLDVAPYIAYLRAKYGELYDLGA
jgi:carboxypeptidase Taq